MKQEYFTDKNSILRQIWGKSDTILFIFAGASAEFALNKAVDWLYFTGKLPADPLGRLFSTVTYARKIVFAEKSMACKAIDKMSAIHTSVENNRGSKIPDWAYRDVLFMLIDYSIRSYEILERPLKESEKEEVFQVFNRVGIQMGIPGLPENLESWEEMRRIQLTSDLEYSTYTSNLYKQYRLHLGALRFKLLLEAQKILVPDIVFKELKLHGPFLLRPVIPLYRLFKKLQLDAVLKELILPRKYKSEIKALDIA